MPDPTPTPDTAAPGGHFHVGDRVRNRYSFGVLTVTNLGWWERRFYELVECPHSESGSGTAALTDDPRDQRIAELENLIHHARLRIDRDRARVAEVERLTGFLNRAGFEVCTSCDGRGGTATVEDVRPCGDCNGLCIVSIDEAGDGDE